MLSVQPTNLYRNNPAFTAGKLNDEQKENIRDGAVAGGAAGGGFKMFQNARKASHLTAETTRKIKESQQLSEKLLLLQQTGKRSKRALVKFKANCKIYKQDCLKKLQQ